MTSFVADARKQIVANVKFPKRVYAVFSGTAEATAKAQDELLLNSAIAAAGILLLLIVVTGNWRNLLLILANVPFALFGGVLAVVVTTKGARPAKSADSRSVRWSDSSPCSASRPATRS